MRRMRKRRVLWRAVQRLRPAVASTPRTVALARALPPRAPSAAHMRWAKGVVLAMADAFGKEIAACACCYGGARKRGRHA